MIIALIIILIIFFAILIQYNNIIKLRNNVKKSESGIDVYLNQRFDLIPNLVECVKAYSNHETDVLENIAKLRSEYVKDPGLNVEKASKLNSELNNLIAVAENYPDLKASEQYLNLQRNLSKIESQLQAARRIYNNEVTTYNTKINQFPTNIIAEMFNFKDFELFTIEDNKKENININLEK